MNLPLRSRRAILSLGIVVLLALAFGLILPTAQVELRGELSERDQAIIKGHVRSLRWQAVRRTIFPGALRAVAREIRSLLLEPIQCIIVEDNNGTNNQVRVDCRRRKNSDDGYGSSHSFIRDPTSPGGWRYIGSQNWQK